MTGDGAAASARTGAASPARPLLDVSGLPETAFGARSLMWWGTLGIMAIEGTVFVLAIATYFYLRMRVKDWPPGVIPPALIYGTINTVIVLVSAIPNQITKHAAEREDLRGVRIWLTVSEVLALAFVIVRWFEFRALNVRWDTNAYGSAVWMLLGLHATHLVTDFLDSLVLLVLMFIGPIQEKRFVDVSENALYWWFVVLAWLPIYVTIYWVPRIL